jgi:anti-sigma B factor antagonist
VGEVDGAAQAAVTATSDDAGTPTIRIAGELDMSNVAGVEAEIGRLRAEMAAPPAFELSDLEFIDSSGLAMFLRLFDATGPVHILGASDAVRLVIDSTGLGDVLRVEP